MEGLSVQSRRESVRPVYVLDGGPSQMLSQVYVQFTW